MLNQVSTNGSSPLYVRLGTASGIENAAYSNANTILATGAATITAVTTAFPLTVTSSYTFANTAYSGQYIFSSFGSDTWAVSGGLGAPVSIYSFISSTVSCIL